MERKIQENVSEEFDCGVSEGDEFYRAGNGFGFVVEAGRYIGSDRREKICRDESGCGTSIDEDGTIPLSNFGLNNGASKRGIEWLGEY